MKDRNDWISENEERDMKRRAYNDLVNGMQNLTAGENLFIKLCTGAVILAATLVIVATFLRITAELLHGIS